jgi:hypothetical protein
MNKKGWSDMYDYFFRIYSIMVWSEKSSIFTVGFTFKNKKWTKINVHFLFSQIETR